MNAIKPLFAFALAAPSAAPASVDETLAEVAVPAAGLLPGEFPEMHAARQVSKQMAPSAAVIGAGRDGGHCGHELHQAAVHGLHCRALTAEAGHRPGICGKRRDQRFGRRCRSGSGM